VVHCSLASGQFSLYRKVRSIPSIQAINQARDSFQGKFHQPIYYFSLPTAFFSYYQQALFLPRCFFEQWKMGVVK
jgi:hypothetical protein